MYWLLFEALIRCLRSTEWGHPEIAVNARSFQLDYIPIPHFDLLCPRSTSETTDQDLRRATSRYREPNALSFPSQVRFVQ